MKTGDVLEKFEGKHGDLSIVIGEKIEDESFVRLSKKTHWIDVVYNYDGDDCVMRSFLEKCCADAFIDGWKHASGEAE